MVINHLLNGMILQVLKGVPYLHVFFLVTSVVFFEVWHLRVGRLRPTIEGVSFFLGGWVGGNGVRVEELMLVEDPCWIFIYGYTYLYTYWCTHFGNDIFWMYLVLKNFIYPHSWSCSSLQMIIALFHVDVFCKINYPDVFLQVILYHLRRFTPPKETRQPDIYKTQH